MRMGRSALAGNRVDMNATRLPALRGGLLALLAALLFGFSTPLLQRAGEGLGAFTTAFTELTASVGVQARRLLLHAQAAMTVLAWRCSALNSCWA